MRCALLLGGHASVSRIHRSMLLLHTVATKNLSLWAARWVSLKKVIVVSNGEKAVTLGLNYMSLPILIDQGIKLRLRCSAYLILYISWRQ